MTCILGCWRKAISGHILDNHSPSSFQEASKNENITFCDWSEYPVINDVSGLEWNYTKLLRTSYTTSSPHKSVQRRQDVSHRFILVVLGNGCMYVHPTVYLPSVDQIRLLSLVLKLHLKTNSWNMGTKRTWTHSTLTMTSQPAPPVAVQVTDFVLISLHYYSYTAIPCMYTDAVENAIFVTSHLDTRDTFPAARCGLHYNYAIKVRRRYSFQLFMTNWGPVQRGTPPLNNDAMRKFLKND